MRSLVVVHRWLGVAFCLLFAMWFVSGIVMHFVAFPALTEAERVAGLAKFDAGAAPRDPRPAIAASGIRDATRVRLFAREDQPVYVVQGASGLHALKADGLTSARVQSERMAITIAASHARRRGMPADAASFEQLTDYDQWTVSGSLDPHRPLYRIALNDDAGTEFYISSATGEIVRDTNRSERGWNYAGSVVHWIYPTSLRRHLDVWRATVWALSLAALVAALSGTVLGIWSLRVAGNRVHSPYAGWQAWHHWLGLCSAIFVLTWTFSGWLSMDHGQLFSRGKVTPAEATAVADAAAWKTFSASGIHAASRDLLEVEWFVFAGSIYRRERYDLATQKLTAGDTQPGRVFLRAEDVNALGSKLAPACQTAVPLTPADDYAAQSTMPGAPVYQLVCGQNWL